MSVTKEPYNIEHELVSFCKAKFRTILADPPGSSKQDRQGGAGKTTAEQVSHMNLQEIMDLPVSQIADEQAISTSGSRKPGCLGLAVMEAWGFQYKTNLIREKDQVKGWPTRCRGVGFYFRT
jgi:N6-adenosine-specific RNA methylase IME4